MYLKEPITLVEQKWSVEDAPVVSVFNWVYNHNNYIRESIKSILMQKTAFPVEIIIHDDASNDGSTNIIKEYELKYPHLFKNILHIENQWSQGKSVMDPLFEKPRGKYIGLNHGDDYWTDPYKLQKQVDFLEANPEYNLVVHDAIKIDEKGNKLSDYYFKPPKSTFNQKDLMQLGCQTPTCSMVFRSECIKDINPVLLNIMCDQILELVISDNGKMFYMPDNMAAYRIHSGGVWSAKKNIERFKEALHRWKTIKSIDRYYKNYKQEIDEAIVFSSKEICEDIHALISVRRLYYGFLIYTHSNKKGLKTFIFLLKMVVFPQLYNLYKLKIRGVGKFGLY